MKNQVSKPRQFLELIIFIIFPFSAFIYYKRKKLSNLSFMISLLFIATFASLTFVSGVSSLVRDLDKIIIFFFSIGAATGLLEDYIKSVGKKIRSRFFLYILLYLWCLILILLMFYWGVVGNYVRELHMLAGLSSHRALWQWIFIIFGIGFLSAQIPLVFGRRGLARQRDN